MGEEIVSEVLEYEPGEEFLKLMNDDPERSHSYLHMTWAKILSGVETKWTLEELYRLHKVVVGIMRSSDVKHISNVDTLDTTETLSQVVSLAHESSPYGVFSDLMNKNVEGAHSYLHKTWNMILAGKSVSWTLEEIYRYHKMLLGNMRNSGIKHVSNVDTLDTTETLSSVKEVFGFEDGNISVRKILKHIISKKIKNPIAYLIEDQSSDKVRVLVNIPKNEGINEIIKKRICKILPEKCRGKLELVNEKKVKDNIIPIFELDEDLKNEIFESFMKSGKEEVVAKNNKKIWEHLSDNQKNKKIYEMTLAKSSRRQIAESVGFSKNTIYLRQKNMGLL